MFFLFPRQFMSDSLLMQEQSHCPTLLDPLVPELTHDQLAPSLPGVIPLGQETDNPELVKAGLVMCTSPQHLRQMNTSAVRGNNDLDFHPVPPELARVGLFLMPARPVDEYGRGVDHPNTPAKFSRTSSHWTEKAFPGIRLSRYMAAWRRHTSTIEALHVVTNLVAVLISLYVNPLQISPPRSIPFA
jgi:hypothetical protein